MEELSIDEKNYFLYQVGNNKELQKKFVDCLYVLAVLDWEVSESDETVSQKNNKFIHKMTKEPNK